MNLPVYEEKKEEKRERKTRKVCESNARFPNRALNTRAADKRKTFERRQKRRARTIKSNGISDALFIYLSLKLFSSARLYEWVFVVQKGLEILFRRNCKKSVFDRFFPRCLERIRSGQTLLKEKKAPRENIEK